MHVHTHIITCIPTPFQRMHGAKVHTAHTTSCSSTTHTYNKKASMRWHTYNRGVGLSLLRSGILMLLTGSDFIRCGQMTAGWLLAISKHFHCYCFSVILCFVSTIINFQSSFILLKLSLCFKRLLISYQFLLFNLTNVCCLLPL